MATTTRPNDHALDPHRDQIFAALAGIRYGSVEIVIHDGRIVQIERREKIRLEPDVKRGVAPSSTGGGHPVKE